MKYNKWRLTMGALSAAALMAFAVNSFANAPNAMDYTAQDAAGNLEPAIMEGGNCCGTWLVADVNLVQNASIKMALINKVIADTALTTATATSPPATGVDVQMARNGIQTAATVITINNKAPAFIEGAQYEFIFEIVAAC